MWYSLFKAALRKQNLRADFRVYAGEEQTQPVESDLAPRLKSILSSAIIKGLDVVGIVSKYGIEAGNMARSLSEKNNIDVKVIPGQDYKSSDNFTAVFFNIQQNVPQGLDIISAVKQCKSQKGQVMLYNLTKTQNNFIEKSLSSELLPDLVEIYNSHSKAYKDLTVTNHKVMSSAARSSSELEASPIYTEIQRKTLEEIGMLAQQEGIEYTPGYLTGGVNG